MGNRVSRLLPACIHSHTHTLSLSLSLSHTHTHTLSVSLSVSLSFSASLSLSAVPHDVAARTEVGHEFDMVPVVEMRLHDWKPIRDKGHRPPRVTHDRVQLRERERHPHGRDVRLLPAAKTHEQRRQRLGVCGE